MTLAVDTEGAHPASILCLEALQWLHARKQFSNILEIGCGNGILALTAASIWDARVIAGDISPQAIEDTKRNIEGQKIANVSAIRSDGFDHEMIRKNAPYDLIICNLLAELLVRMGNDVKNHSKSGSYVIFSGILTWKAEATLTLYKSLKFDIIQQFNNSPWNCYILCHR